MAVLQARTRRQLRVHVCHGLGVLHEGTASGGNTLTITDTSLSVGAADDERGNYVYFTGPVSNINTYRRLTASSIAAAVTTLTWVTAVTSVAANDTYHLIRGIHPDRIHDAINQAILETTGYYFDPVESLALHADGAQGRFRIPSGMAMVSDVQYRRSVTYETIHNCDADWDEQTVANVTRVLDTEDKKQGGGAVKFTVAAGFTTGVIGSKAITALDLSQYDYLECWIKSTVATAAGDLRILLDDTARVASVLENLQVPALVADTWTYVRLALDAPELLTAVISVGLRVQVDNAAQVIWIDDVKAVKNDTAVWSSLNRNTWSIDKEARDLVIHSSGVGLAGYSLLKLVGGDKPALLSVDADVTEVPDDYVIARAQALLLRAGLGMPSMDAATKMGLSRTLANEAALAKRAISGGVGQRLVD